MSASDVGEVAKWTLYFAVWLGITFRMRKAKQNRDKVASREAGDDQ
jgi:hypothetical protein